MHGPEFAFGIHDFYVKLVSTYTEATDTPAEGQMGTATCGDTSGYIICAEAADIAGELIGAAGRVRVAAETVVDVVGRRRLTVGGMRLADFVGRAACGVSLADVVGRGLVK